MALEPNLSRASGRFAGEGAPSRWTKSPDYSSADYNRAFLSTARHPRFVAPTHGALLERAHKSASVIRLMSKY